MNVSRRQFFTRFGQALMGSLQPDGVGRGRPAASSGPAGPSRAWLRPPGALPEPEFLRECTHCTDCIEACPHGAIRRLGEEHGSQAGTPAIVPLDTPCYLCEDTPCLRACEPKALVPVLRDDVSMGRAVLRPQACYRALGQPCEYCVDRCPLRNRAIRWAEDGLPVIDEAVCTGCGVCAYLCPAGALFIEPD